MWFWLGMAFIATLALLGVSLCRIAALADGRSKDDAQW